MDGKPHTPATQDPSQATITRFQIFLDFLRLISPLIAILISLPLTIYGAINAPNTMPKVIFGIGGSVVTLVLLGLFLERRRERLRLQFEARVDARITAKLAPLVELEQRIVHFEDAEAYRYLSGKYGWGYDSVEIICKMDKNGTAQYQRNVSVHSRAHNPWVEQSLLVRQDPGAEAPSREKLKVVDTTNRAQLMQEPQDVQGGWIARVGFQPPLTPDDHQSFTLLEDLPITYRFNVKPEELKDKPEKVDYIGWRIDRPMRRLTLRAVFPKGFAPQGDDSCYIRACYQPLPVDIQQARRHQEEEKRLKIEKMQPTPAGEERFQMVVSDPMLGLVYMIVWDPTKL